MSNNPAPSARLAAMRLALAQRAGFATIEEHTAHKRAEYATMCARIDAERAQEAAARRRLESAPRLLTGLSVPACRSLDVLGYASTCTTRESSTA